MFLMFDRHDTCYLICSGQAESLGKEEEGTVGSMTSDEANNWGMDDSIDVNAVRAIIPRKKLPACMSSCRPSLVHSKHATNARLSTRVFLSNLFGNNCI